MKLYIVRMTLELCSPLHIGSGADDPLLDAPVVRDAFGDYRLPGSSLAGAARAFAADHGFEGLFGRGDADACASSIEFSDGFLLDWDGRPVLEKRLQGERPSIGDMLEVQEHVRIDHQSGAAEDSGKFDAEVVSSGLRFRIELTFHEPWADSAGNAGKFALAFAEVASAIAEGKISVGGGITSGLGLIKAVTGTVSHDVFAVRTVAGLEAARNRPSAITSPMAQAGLPPRGMALQEPAFDDSVSGWLRMRLQVNGPILVGGSQRPRAGGTAAEGDARAADLVFGEMRVADYASGQMRTFPWVPGSSLKGVIRHRVWHVADAIGHDAPKAFVDGLFGSVDGAQARMSKVTVLGHVLEDVERTVVQHVAIDRLTGGSLRGALFSEAPIWKDGLLLDVELRFGRLAPLEAALLAHALLDLAEGELPVGGGVNRGNGSLGIATENAPDKSLGGKAVTFQLQIRDRIISNASPSSELDDLLGMLEAELGALTSVADGGHRS